MRSGLKKLLEEFNLDENNLTPTADVVFHADELPDFENVIGFNEVKTFKGDKSKTRALEDLAKEQAQKSAVKKLGGKTGIKGKQGTWNLMTQRRKLYRLTIKILREKEVKNVR